MDPLLTRDDGVIALSYVGHVGGATFDQIMGLILITYHTNFPGTRHINPDLMMRSNSKLM